MKNRVDSINTNVHMFLEDFSRSYSIYFSPLSKNYHSNYIIVNNKNLKELLTHEDYSYLNYNFDRLLEQITYNLFVNGKAYVEILETRNDKGKLQGLTLTPLNVAKIKKYKNNYIVKERQFNGIVITKTINKPNIIKFDISNIGLSKRKIIKMFKKMHKIDLPKPDLLLNQSDIGFDYNKYIEDYNYKKLYICKDVFWFFRDNSNPFMSECYLLYRLAKFAELRQHIFNYLLNQINNGLIEIGKTNDFKGCIKECWKNIDYEKCLNSLNSGEYNTSQAGDIIIKKLK